MPELDKDLIHSLLREIHDIAATCSMTGAMTKSAPTLVEMYNRLLRFLAEGGDQTVLVLFRELTDAATPDEIGTSAALLSRYVRPEPRRHHVGHGCGGEHVGPHGRAGMHVIHLGPEDEAPEGSK